MAYLGTCIGLIAALALIGVGATVVRKARPTSGYLFIAAGVLELLMGCCRFGSSPERMMEMVADPDVVHFTLLGVSALAILEWLIVGVLIAVALVGLARDLRATTPKA